MPEKRPFIETALGEWFVLGELKLSPDLWRQFSTSPSPIQRAESMHHLPLLETWRGQVEGGRCLLTRDNHCGEREVLHPKVINLQPEDGSSNRIHLFFALESLLDHSEGPESCDQDTLPRKKTKRLMNDYLRDGKSESFGD